jgi:hypothetical protein
MVAATVAPAVAAARPTFWDLVLGSAAEALPAGFAEFACGTDGGAPGRPISGFAEFALCQPDQRGWHEVYFRYDDEAEYRARALEQSLAVELLAGTRVYGVPVVASALFDPEGVLAELRLSSDARGVEPGDRSDHWTLGNSLMRHFGAEGWHCEAQPLAEGETPVSSYFIKDRCTKTIDAAELTIRREYYHRRGHQFVDDFGKAQPASFVSTARFEMVRRP